jgi:hypothetical protein
VVPSSTKACVTATLSEPIPDQKDVEQIHEKNSHPNASIKNENRPTCKPAKGDMDLVFKNKRVGRLISRKL